MHINPKGQSVSKSSSTIQNTMFVQAWFIQAYILPSSIKAEIMILPSHIFDVPGTLPHLQFYTPYVIIELIPHV